MVIDLNSFSKPYLNKTNLISEISEESIFRYYIQDFKINKLIKSPLRRDDSDPSFSVYYSSKTNELLYNDFGGTGGDCIYFVENLYNLSREEAITQIGLDFGLDRKYNMPSKLKNKSVPIGKLDLSAVEYNKVIKKSLNVTIREWLPHDILFWNQFGIHKDTLTFYNVFPIQWIFINSKIIGADKYAYAFIEYKDNVCTYKIYQPYSKIKWLTSHNSSIHQGYTQLPDEGNILIITKSLKDVMSLKDVTGISSIGIQNEVVLIKKSVIEEYKQRFNKVITLFDNDKAGITLAFKYFMIYNIPIMFIPSRYNCKDFSDLVKNYSSNKAKNILNTLINEISNCG